MLNVPDPYGHVIQKTNFKCFHVVEDHATVQVFLKQRYSVFTQPHLCYKVE